MASSARLLALAAALLAAVLLAAAPGADALRSLGVGEDAAAAAQGDAAVDLNATTFDAFLGAVREPFVVVEFFAHWSAPPSLPRFACFLPFSVRPCVRACALRYCPIRFDSIATFGPESRNGWGSGIQELLTARERVLLSLGFPAVVDLPVRTRND
jgi:hypothetical protein